MKFTQAITLAILAWLPVTARPATFPQSGEAPATHSGGSLASEPKFRVIRSVSGSEGVQQGGSYVIRDPRTVFYVPQDQKVIVYFEWEGPSGLHHFEGVWKSPDGKTTSISNFDYEAKQGKFGGYWEMLIAASTQTGMWGLEARVDGEVTGKHSFQILAAAAPESKGPKRYVLTSAELYDHSNSATVTIASLNSAGVTINRGMGFFVDQNRLLTAFQVIEGAANIRVTLPDGRTIETHEVAAWNRRQDVALLKVAADSSSRLAFAPPGKAVVGERYYMLDANSAGARLIESITIAGVSDFPNAGRRLNLSSAPSRAGIGSALFNEYGEVIAVVGGSLVPGGTSAERQHSNFSMSFLEANGGLRAGMASPVGTSSIPANEGKVTTLAELAAAGEFLPPVVESDGETVNGSISRDVRRENGIQIPVDLKFQFARPESHAVVLVTFEPKKKRKSSAALAIYDLDNHLIGQSASTKLELSPGKMTFFAAPIDLVNLVSGVYRADVLVDGNPVWRTFFRVTD